MRQPVTPVRPKAAEHPVLVRVAPRGLFAPGNADGAAFAEATNRRGYAALEVKDEAG